MDQSEITEKLTSLLRTVFNDDKIVLRNDLKAAKLEKQEVFKSFWLLILLFI